MYQVEVKLEAGKFKIQLENQEKIDKKYEIEFNEKEGNPNPPPRLYIYIIIFQVLEF